jgi:hypothetical protein
MSPLLSCLLRRHPHLLCTSPLLPCLPRPQFMLLPSPSLPCLPHTPRLPRPSLRLSTFRARCTRCTCRAQARRARRSSARRARRLLHPSLAHLSHLCPMHTPHAPRPEPAARIADTRCRTRRPPRAQVQRARRARPLSLRTHRVCCTSAVFIATRDLRACRAHRSCRALWRLSRWTPRTRCCTWRPLRPKPYVLVAIDHPTMCPAPCTPSPSLLQSRRPSRPKFHACCARRALATAPVVLRTRSRARRPSRPKLHACCARRALTPAPVVLRTRSRARRPLRPKSRTLCPSRTCYRTRRAAHPQSRAAPVAPQVSRMLCPSHTYSCTRRAAHPQSRTAPAAPQVSRMLCPSHTYSCTRRAAHPQLRTAPAAPHPPKRWPQFPSTQHTSFPLPRCSPTPPFLRLRRSSRPVPNTLAVITALVAHSRPTVVLCPAHTVAPAALQRPTTLPTCPKFCIFVALAAFPVPAAFAALATHT